MQEPASTLSPEQKTCLAKQPLAFRVKSLTRKGITYGVSYADRRWTCSCPSARYRRGKCKHVAMLRVLGLRRAMRFAVSPEGRP